MIIIFGQYILFFEGERAPKKREFFVNISKDCGAENLAWEESFYCFRRARKINLVDLKKSSSKLSIFFLKNPPLKKILNPPLVMILIQCAIFALIQLTIWPRNVYFFKCFSNLVSLSKSINYEGFRKVNEHTLKKLNHLELRFKRIKSPLTR